jgi:hypothetical protein
MTPRPVLTSMRLPARVATISNRSTTPLPASTRISTRSPFIDEMLPCRRVSSPWSLDFLYLPSRDVGADLAWARDGLGAHVVFAIDSGGTRVAMVEVRGAPPALLFADHIGQDSGILVYAVDDLGAEAATLAGRGWAPEASLEIPMGPCRTFRSPGGTRLALYQPTRPDVLEHFRDRFDF